MTESERWPAIPVAEWHQTRDTLQLYTQVVGKVRLANEPPSNHWWNVPLYVTSRGLTTSPMPHPTGPTFEIGFDFVDLKQCHRYLLSELLAAKTRSGPYGGSLENRTRLARDIARKIEETMQYPGQIRVTVIRETRAVDYAK